MTQSATNTSASNTKPPLGNGFSSGPSVVSVGHHDESSDPRTERWPLGSLRAFRRDPLGFMEALAAHSPGVAPFRLGPQPAALVSSPKAFREVLVSRAKHFEKGRIQRRALVPVLRNGLLIAEGDLHTRQRQLLAPMFASRKIAGYVNLIAQQAQTHADRLTDGEQVELLEVMGAMTRDVIRALLWSDPLPNDDALADAVTGAFEWEMHQLFSVAAAPPWVPTPRNLRMRHDTGLVRRTIGNVIEARRRDGLRRGDLLDQLLTAQSESDRHQERMSDDQVLDEVVTLWGAAHETSADAQFWTAHLLARHPQIRQAVESEADRVLGDRLPTPDDLAHLPLSLQVFKEAMRLYPPAASTLRQARVNTEIDGVQVRRGTLMFLSTFAMHRNPALFPDPMRFDPSRHTSEVERERHRFAYLPFGAGPHVCIGSTLALTEGQVFTAVLARRLRFEPLSDGPVEPQLLINLRPRDAVPVVVRHRHTATSKTGNHLD